VVPARIAHRKLVLRDGLWVASRVPATRPRQMRWLGTGGHRGFRPAGPQKGCQVARAASRPPRWHPPRRRDRYAKSTHPPRQRRSALRLTESRSEEHTSELQHVAISYAVFCLKKKNY